MAGRKVKRAATVLGGFAPLDGLCGKHPKNSGSESGRLRTAALLGFCVPRRIWQNGIEFCCNRTLGFFFCVFVSLPKKGSLFKLSLVGRGKALGFNGPEKFSHHEQFPTHLTLGFSYFKRQLWNFRKTTTCHTALGHRKELQYQPHGAPLRRLAGVLSTEHQAPMVTRRLRERKGHQRRSRAPPGLLRCVLRSPVCRAARARRSLPAFSPF